ncbi:hypothetical protein Lfu02_80270 [Longispora fulva]|nr:hypothetical protein Lfu02_80270 [Longispora fulva]
MPLGEEGKVRRIWRVKISYPEPKLPGSGGEANRPQSEDGRGDRIHSKPKRWTGRPPGAIERDPRAPLS